MPAPIPMPDGHFLNATSGWLMLGNPQEARVEFDQISSAYRQHPEVMLIEWSLLAAEHRWEAAREVAETHVRLVPGSAYGWIHRSFALHELKRTREALEKLLPVAGKFSDEPTIPYNLSCYTCQLGDLVAARDWLKKAFAMESVEGSREERLRSATEDCDLQPLWDEIRRGDFQ
jgi:predicted Zn-dependent protease